MTADSFDRVASDCEVVSRQISVDPFRNPQSQHETQVEPDSFAVGPSVLAAFQSGRIFNGGASNIGFSFSPNRGATWTRGFLPSTTASSKPAGPWPIVSDPSVAYDAAHGVWMVSSIPLLPNTSVPTVFFNRSTDDGQTWGPAISMPPPVSNSVDFSGRRSGLPSRLVRSPLISAPLTLVSTV